MLGYLGLLLVAVLVAPVALAPVYRPADRLVTRVALFAFGGWVAEYGRRRSRRRRLLQSVHVAETYRMFAAKTLLYAGLAALVGSVLGVYVVAGVLAVLKISPATIEATLPAELHFLSNLLVFPNLSIGQLFVLLLASSATVGVLSGATTYWSRWQNLSYRANARERKIDESISRTVAFIYALSRSGMAFPEIMRTLARNRSVYGEAAEEVAVAVKAMDYTGLDMLSAIERLAHQTPSEKFGEFADNLANVLQSGQSISMYLDDQYERYQEDAEAQQESFLELLATLAEGYVTLFVVAPLLFITILVIMGLMALGDTLPLLQLITYVAIPLANVGFIIYLDSITESVRATREDRDVDLTAAIENIRRTEDPTSDRVGVQRPDPEATPIEADGDAAASARSDGGMNDDAGQIRDDSGGGNDDAGTTMNTAGATTNGAGATKRDAGTTTNGAENFERLDAFENVRWLRETVTNPVRTLRNRPTILLYMTVPVALLSIFLRAWPSLTAGTLTLEGLDDLVIQAGLFVVGTFAVAQELHRRRIAAIEAAIPDFLDRLASVNEAGMSVIESLGRVNSGDLGALDVEVEKLWTDIQWGVDAETALYRLEDRLDTPTVTRVVTLLANAMHASGDLARVLRIAADEAQDNRRLKRKRRQEMLTYVVIIYLSFIVFLVIVGSLNSILIPNLPTGGTAPSGEAARQIGASGPLSGISDVDVGAYSLLFFHASLVQALFSGLLAGQMGEGSIKNGAKHATVLLAIAYAFFLLAP
jgi:flagellar protein FlaJ